METDDRFGREIPSERAKPARLALLPLVALGVVYGFGARVVTSAVTGANIGGGLVLLATPVLTVTAIAASASGLSRAIRRPQQS